MLITALVAADLVAILIMVFGLYFPRHRRKDLVVAFLGVNIGVLAVASALSAAGAGIGLGLGLFGVLSIIRLRSAELDQEEIAYYFAALALGLLGGLSALPIPLTVALMGLILFALFAGDHPRLFRGYHTQSLTLDAAFVDRGALRLHLEQLLNADVHRLQVRKVDLVNDTTNVEVRYRLRARPIVPGGGLESLETASSEGLALR